MQAVVRVLRARQCLQFRDPDVHLLRRLSVRRIEELEFQPGQLPPGPGLGDRVGGGDVGDDRGVGGDDPDAAAHRPPRVDVQHAAERVERPPGHRVARHHVLPDRVLVERRDRARCDDRHLPRGHVGRVDHALDPAVMVDVGVGVDHRDHRLVADMLPEQGHALLRRFDPAHAVDDDQAVFAFDDGQVRDVVVPGLVHPVGHLVQAAPAHHLRLPPQTRIHRVRHRAVIADETKPAWVEDHVPVCGADHRARPRRDQTPVCITEILSVSQVIQPGRIPIHLSGRRCSVLRHERHRNSLPAQASPEGTHRHV